MMVKSIKDPIYGYVEIEDMYIPLIDDAPFQRLRHIRQTGYQALYPSAEHTRFVHSLGVFHLGKKAIAFLKKNLEQNQLLTQVKNWGEIENTFLLACLLHDVGHSPFSHTGEDFYNIGINFVEALNKALDQKPDMDDIPAHSFKADIKNSNSGKAHESMSCLIGLDLCKKHGLAIDRELFVRAIIGLHYTDDSVASQCRNAVITLLNGDLIDVDKLDYVTRDAFATGFSSLSIDIDRLLAGFTVCEDNDGALCMAYQRKSLSVIENVIYANDLERRWVQNHPVILYDCELIRFAIMNYDESVVKKAASFSKPECRRLDTAFTKEALSPTGLKKMGLKLRLLCDDDIIHYIKNDDSSVIAEQIFSRDKRLKPMWKTEAEFDSLVRNSLGENILKRLIKDLKSTLDLLQPITYFFIDEKAERDLTVEFNKIDGSKRSTVKTSYQRAIHICTLFRDFVTEHSLPDFKFAAILSGKFNSAYKKLDPDRIKIQLSPRHVEGLDSIISVKAKENSRRDEPQNLFYVYTTKKNLTYTSDLGEKLIEFVRMKYRP